MFPAFANVSIIISHVCAVIRASKKKKEAFETNMLLSCVPYLGSDKYKLLQPGRFKTPEPSWHVSRTLTQNIICLANSVHLVYLHNCILNDNRKTRALQSVYVTLNK